MVGGLVTGTVTPPSCKLRDCLSRFRPFFGPMIYNLDLEPLLESFAPASFSLNVTIYNPIVSRCQLPPTQRHLVTTITVSRVVTISSSTLIKTKWTITSREWRKIFVISGGVSDPEWCCNMFHEFVINPTINSIFHYN